MSTVAQFDWPGANGTTWTPGWTTGAGSPAGTIDVQSTMGRILVGTTTAFATGPNGFYSAPTQGVSNYDFKDFVYIPTTGAAYIVSGMGAVAGQMSSGGQPSNGYAVELAPGSNNYTFNKHVGGTRTTIATVSHTFTAGGTVGVYFYKYVPEGTTTAQIGCVVWDDTGGVGARTPMPAMDWTGTDTTPYNGATKPHLCVGNGSTTAARTASFDELLVTDRLPAQNLPTHVGTSAIAANVSTVTTITYPPGVIVAGDLLICAITSKPSATAAATISGWTVRQDNVVGGGTAGAGTGTQRHVVYTKIADGTEGYAGNLTLAVTTSTATALGAISAFRSSTGVFDISTSYGTVATAATALSAASLTTMDVALNDLMFFSLCASANTNLGSSTVNITSVTFGTATEHADAGTGNGDDARLSMNSRPITAGSITGTVTATSTASASTTAGAVFIRIREGIAATQVTATFASTWNVRANVTATAANTWHIRNSQVATWASTWNLRAAVAQTFVSGWNIRAFTSRTFASTWNVRAGVQRTFADVWQIRNLVSRTYTADWNIRAAVVRALSSSWNVRAFVVQGLANTWNVRSGVVRTLSGTWNIRASVIATSGNSWNIRNAIARNDACTWHIRNSVSDTSRISTWNIRNQVAIAQGSSWNVRALVSRGIASTWNVRAGVTLTQASTWHIRNLVARTLASSWALRASVTNLNGVATWNVRAYVTKALASTWHIRNQVLREYITTWDIGNVLVAEFPATWNVRANVAATYGSTWNVRVPVTRALANSWSIRNEVARGWSDSWQVRSAVQRNLASNWNIRAFVTREFSDSWVIRNSVQQNLANSWNVRSAVLVTLPNSWKIAGQGIVLLLPSTWNVRAAIVQQMSSTWAIRSTVNRDLASSWNIRAALLHPIPNTWNIRNSVNRSMAESWNIRNKVSRHFATTWNIYQSDTGDHEAIIEGPWGYPVRLEGGDTFNITKIEGPLTFTVEGGTAYLVDVQGGIAYPVVIDGPWRY